MENSDQIYLDQIARLGEDREITCSEDILSTEGAKLLPKGAQINRQMIKRLINHKLLKPIDCSTRIENALDLPHLVSLGQEMMARDSEMGHLLRMLRDDAFVRHSCSRIHLAPPVQNKLTVARELHPELLEHSLRVALAISIVGEQLGLPESELEVLATAGLLHDLGELHLEVGNLPPGQALGLEQWQQVRSHPLIGAMILQQIPAYPKQVVRAVREHHERLDGSGYPHGLKAIRISRAGRLLAFTEMAIGALRKYSLRQLDTIVKSNLDGLDPQPVAIFRSALHRYQQAQTPGSAKSRQEDVSRLCRLITDLVKGAEEMRASITLPGDKSDCVLDETLNKLHRAMRRAGLDLGDSEATLQMVGDDPESLRELDELLRESLFQLRQAILEMHRRSQELAPQGEIATELKQWLQATRADLDAAGALLR